VNHGADGSQVQAVANTGYTFVNWSDSSTQNPRRETNVTAAVSVTANFAINQYTLTYSAGTGGSISGISPQTVNHGADGAEVEVVANAGYTFVNWSDSSTQNPRTDLNVTGNVTVTANFAINQYTLTYTAGAGGTISGTTPQTVNHGASGTSVTAATNTGYQFARWSDGSAQNPRTDINVTANLSVTANFRTNSVLTWTMADFLTTVKPLEHTAVQAAGFVPLLGWDFPEVPNYWGEAVTQRGNGTLQTKWSNYWSRLCVPWVNLRGLPDPTYPGLMTNAIAAALTFQDLGIPIHLFIDPWEWYLDWTPAQYGHMPYDFWPEGSTVDGRDVWWTDVGGVRVHPVYPWSINTEAYDSMVYTLQNFKDGGITNASVGGAWSDYETLPHPFNNELEWQKEWYLANPTGKGFVNPYDALIQAYAGGNATAFWTGLNGPFAQYAWDLRLDQVTGGILQPVRDVFGAGPVFGEYFDMWSSPGNPTYDANGFPYAVSMEPAGVSMPSVYANNYFLPSYLGGTNPAINQANADAVHWFLMMRTASGSVGNAPATDRHVFWVGSDCRDSAHPDYQYGMTRPLYREFLRHIFLRKASGIVTFTAFDAAYPDISLPMYEDARWVLDEMLSYRSYLQDLPSTSTARKVLNTSYAPVFSTVPVWSGMANTSIPTGERWLVRVVSMSGAATNLTITPEPSFASTQFTLAAPTNGATYLLHTAGTAQRTDTRPSSAYLELDGSYADSSGNNLVASGDNSGTGSVAPSFTNAVPASSIAAAQYGLYGNRTNSSAVALTGTTTRTRGNYVTIPNTSNVLNGTEFTVEGWVYVRGQTLADASVFSKGVNTSSVTNWDWQVRYNTNQTLTCYFSAQNSTSNSWVRTANNAFTSNAWHHVALVYSNRAVTLYIDHVPQAWAAKSSTGITYSGTTATVSWPIRRRTGDSIRMGMLYRNIVAFMDEFRYTPEALGVRQLQRTGPLP
jgi:uncharacterized repeat protein (TIGR02543 family)